MMFWDASALVPLCVREAHTPRSIELFEADSDLLCWLLSATEIWSALCRRHREGGMTDTALVQARMRRDQLLQAATIVRDTPAVMSLADRLLAVHTLRAADALQLAAALVVFGDAPANHTFVTYDERLAASARREGFQTPI